MDNHRIIDPSGAARGLNQLAIVFRKLPVTARPLPLPTGLSKKWEGGGRT